MKHANKLWYGGLTLLWAMLASCIGPTVSEVVLDNSYDSDKYNYDNAQTFLGRRINMGSYLEAPNKGDWTGGRKIQGTDLSKIKAVGFKSVRIPIRWSAHTGTVSPYSINVYFMNPSTSRTRVRNG